MGGRGRMSDMTRAHLACPYPLPWTWTGRLAGRWSVQDGPRWLQEGLREPKMTSKLAPNIPRCIKMVPEVLQEAPRPLQDGSERLRSRRQEAQILQTPKENQ
eukprot:6705314-Pyramimonas_sp.AAC.1